MVQLPEVKSISTYLDLQSSPPSRDPVAHNIDSEVPTRSPERGRGREMALMAIRTFILLLLTLSLLVFEFVLSLALYPCSTKIRAFRKRGLNTEEGSVRAPSRFQYNGDGGQEVEAHPSHDTDLYQAVRIERRMGMRQERRFRTL